VGDGNGLLDDVGGDGVKPRREKPGMEFEEPPFGMLSDWGWAGSGGSPAWYKEKVT